MIFNPFWSKRCGKTAKYLGFEMDFEDDQTFWSKQKEKIKVAIQHGKQRRRLKLLARQNAQDVLSLTNVAYTGRIIFCGG